MEARLKFLPSSPLNFVTRVATVYCTRYQSTSSEGELQVSRPVARRHDVYAIDNRMLGAGTSAPKATKKLRRTPVVFHSHSMRPMFPVGATHDSDEGQFCSCGSLPPMGGFDPIPPKL